MSSTEAFRRWYRLTQKFAGAVEIVDPDLVAGVQQKRHILLLVGAIQVQAFSATEKASHQPFCQYTLL